MTVRVDELSSDVSVEREPESTAGVPPQETWQQADAFRAMRERLARDAARTRAEAYDD
jgi:hypothetical protein